MKAKYRDTARAGIRTRAIKLSFPQGKLEVATSGERTSTGTARAATRLLEARLNARW
jgi:hypothetical protein